MSSPQNTKTQTMFNLQTKRTLPREVIKWMQGLDLSYSVKDYRKDMANGFLIGQIISRYQPGKIPMHAFENSQNAVRRANNWGQLDLFFRKFSIRQVEIEKEQYDNIMKNKDNKSQQLYLFICRLYTVCTKRTLPENAPLLDLPPVQATNPNLTASYLLKEDGVQKMDNSGVHPLASSGLNKSNLDNSKIQQKSMDRVPTRKINPNLDNSSAMVDVTGIGIKSDNRKMTSKRKSWQQHPQIDYEEENFENEKLIFDYLNEIIEDCIPSEDLSLKEILIPESGKYRPTDSLKKALPNVDKQFMCNFLHQLPLNSTELVPIILRQMNQIWKFFTYFLKMLRHYSSQQQQFQLLISLIKTFAEGCHAKQARRIQKVFMDSLINILAIEVKMSKEWKKRHAIMNLTYQFGGREASDKKMVLGKLKEILTVGSSGLFIEWLSILIKQETDSYQNISNKLIQDYIYYAHQNLASSTVALRTSSLKIFYQISKTQSIELIQSYFYSKIQDFQTSNSEPEQSFLLILIFTNIFKYLLNSKQFNNLIKGNNASSLIKVYNPDNEKIIDEIKRKSRLLGQTIYKLFDKTGDITVKEISARIAVEFVAQSEWMMKILLEFIAVVEEKQAFLKAEASEYELKSMTYNCPAVNTSIITENANQILGEIVNIILQKNNPLENYLFLVFHCLESLNIKKINMQIWQDISTHIVKPLIELWPSKNSCDVTTGIKNICNLCFNFDMKIRQINGWLADSIFTIYNEKNQQNIQEVSKFNDYLNEEFTKSHNDSIRFMVEQINDVLERKGIENVLTLKEQ